MVTSLLVVRLARSSGAFVVTPPSSLLARRIRTEGVAGAFIRVLVWGCIQRGKEEDGRGLLTWRSFVRAPVSRRRRWGAARHPLQANLCVQVVSASDEGREGHWGVFYSPALGSLAFVRSCSFVRVRQRG